MTFSIITLLLSEFATAVASIHCSLVHMLSKPIDFNDFNREFVTLIVLSFVGGELDWSQKNGRFSATSHSEFSGHSICSCRQSVDIAHVMDFS